MKKKALIIIIFLQLLFIAYLGTNIYIKKTKILGSSVKIIPIKKESIVFNPKSKLEYFYEPVPNRINEENAFLPYSVANHINSDGLNDRFEYSPEKDSGTYRIITLGDSYTYGVFVKTKDNWPEKLEVILNNDISCSSVDKFEVINLGVGGYDIEYSFERYKLRGTKYNPDLVIFFLNSDDGYQINELLLPLISEKEKTQTYDAQDPYKIFEESYGEIFKEYKKADLINYQKDILDNFHDHFQGKFIIISFPTTSIGSPEHKVIDAFLPIIDNHPNYHFFNGIDDIYKLEETIIENDGHPNAKGHQIIAKDISEHLLEAKLIPCD
jgi:lysophospholipase L1-like esterase